MLGPDVAGKIADLADVDEIQWLPVNCEALVEAGAGTG